MLQGDGLKSAPPVRRSKPKIAIAIRTRREMVKPVSMDQITKALPPTISNQSILRLRILPRRARTFAGVQR